MEEYIAPNRKRIPYGMMNFAVIRRDDCYYVDKTRFIPIIEDADKFFFFIRPRRFGKSLFGICSAAIMTFLKKRTFSSCSVIYG